MRILAAQINPIVGDLKGNTKKILSALSRCRANHGDLVIFPELALTGYPPEDLLLLPDFIKEVEQSINAIAMQTVGLAAIIGLPRLNSSTHEKHLFNSAAIISNGQIIQFADKMLLPTYDVFDERRYFEPGKKITTWKYQGYTIAVTICEDIWQHSQLVKETQYYRDPILEITNDKPDLIINLSASPYSYSKSKNRLTALKKAAKTVNCPILFCNQVGGNDSLIFDGSSCYLSASGTYGLAKRFEEDDLWIDFPSNTATIDLKIDPVSDLYHALVIGVRDYFSKQQFQKACLGLSGGIDSALVACIAKEALGNQNVLGLIMPSRYSTDSSREDALKLAQNLGIETKELSIEAPFESYLNLLQPNFKHLPVDKTEENIQARIRGMLLMAFSNKFGFLVLSTGNKSEWAMGYSTLYGDLCGGLSVIGDVTKQQVYELARWINRQTEIIPQNTIDKPPSAELKPNQKDSDTLPDYAIIDCVITSYLEEGLSSTDIANRYHHSKKLVESLIKRIHQNEYKRRQAPPALRISEKSFSLGRRFPIVQRWIL